MKVIFFWLISMSVGPALAGEIRTNAAVFSSSPPWLTESKAQRVIGPIQKYLEWDIRRITVVWHPDPAEFQNFHHFDASVLAVSRKSDNSVHLGPRVVDANFAEIFGHELVHVILFQKFGDAVPKWLEEGMANYISRHGSVDYAWLATQPLRDVNTLVHPFEKGAGDFGPAPGSRYHYQASTAAVEMIATKCKIKDLLQMSVGQKLENYLATLCEMPDVNAAFRAWIKKQNLLRPAASPAGTTK